MLRRGRPGTWRTRTTRYALHEQGLSKSDKRVPRKDTCLAIYSHRVNAQTSLAATLTSVFPWCAEWEQELTRLYCAYVDRKLAHQALDYDDLLLYWHAMVQDAALVEQISAQFEQILVNEYQDTNALQAEILQALRPSGSGLTVVGDDAQSIHSFRAASVENILGFPDRYGPATSVLTLEENYRSTQGVLDAANALIAEGQRQYRKTLRAKRGRGERPRYVTVVDDQAQADYVVAHVNPDLSAARGIEIEEVESTVEGDIDLQGFLGTDKSVRNGFQNIRMSFDISVDLSDQELQELAQLGPTFSPVLDSLTKGVPVVVQAQRKRKK